MVYHPAKRRWFQAISFVTDVFTLPVHVCLQYSEFKRFGRHQHFSSEEKGGTSYFPPCTRHLHYVFQKELSNN